MIDLAQCLNHHPGASRHPAWPEGVIASLSAKYVNALSQEGSLNSRRTHYPLYALFENSNRECNNTATSQQMEAA
jgi:hypothetical protein